MTSRANKPDQGAKAGESVKRTPLDDLDVEVKIEHTTAGTPLDDRLRREQTAALLALLAASEGRAESDERGSD
jgi:hypothetical protein